MSTARVRAAGGVLVRATADGETEILLIHRSGRDDWTFPKGKLAAGETDEACALREVEEETALRCTLVEEMTTTNYVDRKGRFKTVRYWIMLPIGGYAMPQNEVDDVQWARLAQAVERLTYERDRTLLLAFRERCARAATLAVSDRSRA
jgi:8-oxo-dGTP pyrophosphatase MutT (NUDIX family)